MQLLGAQRLQGLVVVHLGQQLHFLQQGLVLACGHGRGQPGIQLAKPLESLGQGVDVGALLHAPLPVSAKGGGDIHARLGTQAEHVLHGGDEQVGDGRIARADQAPVVAFLRAQAAIVDGELLFAGRRRVEPAHGGVVVVGAGVDHVVVGVHVGQVDALAAVVKGELQHLHARIPALLEQLGHARGDQSQVLGDDGAARPARA